MSADNHDAAEILRRLMTEPIDSSPTFAQLAQGIHSGRGQLDRLIEESNRGEALKGADWGELDRLWQQMERLRVFLPIIETSERPSGSFAYTSPIRKETVLSGPELTGVGHAHTRQ